MKIDKADDLEIVEELRDAITDVNTILKRCIERKITVAISQSVRNDGMTVKFLVASATKSLL